MLGKLHKEAFVAHVNSQRREGLHVIELLNAHVTLAKGRHAEIDKNVMQARAAKTTTTSHLVYAFANTC